MSSRGAKILFAGYALDLETRELSAHRQRVPLQEKPFRLLVALLERPGRVVSRARLYNVLWPADLHVQREAGLNTAVRKLRSALRELGGGGELLVTVPRTGYRLKVERVERLPAAAPRSLDRLPGCEALDPAKGVTPWRVAALLLLVAGVLASAWVAAQRPAKPTASIEPMPSDPALRENYVEARALLAAMDGDLSRARRLLRALVAESTEFAPGYAYLAEASARLAVRAVAPGDLEEARRSAHRALRIDPRSAVAHRVLAMVAMVFDWDPGAARSWLDGALALDGNDPVTHLAVATYESALGRHQQAIAAVRRAIELEPDSMLMRSDAGYFLLRAGRFGEAARECERALRLDGENAFAHECLLTAYSAGGGSGAARAHAVRLLEFYGAPDAWVARAEWAEDPRSVYLQWSLDRLLDSPDPSAVQVATTYAALGELDRALAWLGTAARERAPLLVFVPHDVAFSQVRGAPGFQRLLRRAGLGELAPRATAVSR